MTATAARLSAYTFMPDDVLAQAIANLERIVSTFPYARGPIAEAVRAGYCDALDAARAEQERRRC